MGMEVATEELAEKAVKDFIPTDVTISGEQLKKYVEKVENLEEKKAEIATDIKDMYTEAKSAGFDTKIMRKIIALRKLDMDQYAEQEALLALYRRALGMDA